MSGRGRCQVETMSNSAAIAYVREWQHDEDRWRSCPSLYASQDGDGKCRVTRFNGTGGLADLGAVAARQQIAKDFEALISVRRFGPVVVGSLKHSAEVVVHPQKRFGHNHEISRVLLCDHGPLMVDAGSRHMKVDSGTGLLISGDTPFRYQAGVCSRVSLMFIDVATEDPVFAGLEQRDLAYWPLPSPSLTALAAFVRSVLHSELDAMPYHERVALRSSLESLVLATLQSAKTPRTDQAVDTVYLRAMEAIRQLHRNPLLTVDDVAQRIGVSRRTLQRAFDGGHGVREWITRMRLDDALTHLRVETELSIDECARRAGFGSSVAMRRAVKSATGCSPTEYRKRKAG